MSNATWAFFLESIKVEVSIKRNKRGHRGGENHPNAKLTDKQIDLMRALHEEHPIGSPEHIGYRRLAQLFECSKNTVRDICKYKCR